MELALDIAFQCAPDHPYVSEHPEWFRVRPDGSLQYAENPPKKYEDIYPFNFESAAWQALWEELKGVVTFWVGHGVQIFRVDNPHTKPFALWEWIIGEVRREHPDVIFLAEAFTRPKVMHRLAKLGFSQSYNYFPWRNTKWELTEYFTELTQGEGREYFRPNLWPNTPDILTEYLQIGGRDAFAVRLVLAATLGASYGIYGPAYELIENTAREPGSEEYLDSEKYQLRHWDLDRPDSLADIIARINRIRREHSAKQYDCNLHFDTIGTQWGDDPVRYKDAVIYQLHVKAFYDSNGDGIGDFRCRTDKLDYIQRLGVNTIWLLPFYPSPMRDDGYDIADYRNIYPAYGTRKDFHTFVREAHQRGLKIITELVVNHTSDQHPWFRAAREAPRDSAKRNYYVRSDTDQKFADTRIIFTDTETSNWAWDPVAQQYYWHRFFSHQPDLNHNNPNVVKAMIRVMRFWLDMGVDGLRLDAIPYICVREGTTNENQPETHAVIKQLRAVVAAHYKNSMFLAEANQWPEDVREYFGDGDECHMAYHFPLMPRIYMAVAQEDRHPITEIMAQTPDIPDNCQWAIFLRNHDELTLEMVTDRERDYMYKRYAVDPRMRINVGIRRRLASLMDNDLDVIKLMQSLLLSMPGTPIIYYGDEIGMGDNIYLGARNGVRTPMQWTPDRNGGFSRADPAQLYLPAIMDPVYGYSAINVEAQTRSLSSLLNWMKRLIGVRKSSNVFGRGTLTFIRPKNRAVFCYVRQLDGEAILCVANLARTAQAVELDLSPWKGRVPHEMLGHTAFPPIGDLPYLLTLASRGFYWFRLAGDVDVPDWHQERLPPQELPMLVLFADWRSFFAEQVEPARAALAQQTRQRLERSILPNFLTTQRWFAAKGETIDCVELHQSTPWSDERGSWLFGFVRVRFANGQTQTYSLPLAITWGDAADDNIRPLLSVALAKVRQRARIGILYDALADPAFSRTLVDAIG